MTKVKICGIKNVQTAQLLAELECDFLGFVFAESKRRVSAEEAGQILRHVPAHPAAVGVFVNPSLSELDLVLARVPLQVIQLHGQESPEFCAEVKARYQTNVWKAIPIGEEKQISTACKVYQPHADAFLFDTFDPQLAGGTGKRFSWTRIPQLKVQAGKRECVIAGGINEANVDELLARYAPAIIDISSGVETDGEKDLIKIKSFLERVREHDKHCL